MFESSFETSLIVFILSQHRGHIERAHEQKTVFEMQKTDNDVVYQIANKVGF